MERNDDLVTISEPEFLKISAEAVVRVCNELGKSEVALIAAPFVIEIARIMFGKDKKENEKESA